MGLPELQAIKKVVGAYKAQEATPRIMASLQPKVKKPIAKQSAKAKAKAAEEKDLHIVDREFYAEIWAASPHKCQCGCGKNLGKEPLTTFFHHLLEKRNFPQFRHTPENIAILHPDCHNAVEQNINNRPLIKKRRQEILKLLIG